MIRPAEHLIYKTPVVIVDGRICAVLNRLLSLDKLRGQVRGQNAELDQTLVAMKLAAVAYAESSNSGTTSAPKPEPVSRCWRSSKMTSVAH